MEDRKRYQFTQDEVIGSDGRRRSSGCSRERCLWILFALLLIGAVVGVSVYFTQNYTHNDDVPNAPERQVGTKGTTSVSIVTGSTKQTQTKPSTTTSPQSTASYTRTELLQRIDCIPEAKGNVTIATRELCDKRFCFYEDTGEDGIPVCYFNPDIGYKVVGVTNTAVGFRVDLEQKMDGPFGNDIERVVFEVHMLGNNIIRFQVRYFLHILFFTYWYTCLFIGNFILTWYNN